MMSRERLPLIGSSRSKKTVLQRPHQSTGRKRPPLSSSSSHPPPPPSVLHSDSTMTPWGGLELSDSSFTSIPPAPPPPSPPAPPPPAPQPTPATPYRRRRRGAGDESSSSLDSEAASSSAVVAAVENRDGGGRGFRAKRRPLPQRRMPRPPRLPPLRQVSNLSFSRSFTFSFFELPLHQSPRCRAERTRNLMVQLRQVHY